MEERETEKGMIDLNCIVARARYRSATFRNAVGLKIVNPSGKLYCPKCVYVPEELHEINAVWGGGAAGIWVQRS